MTKLPSPTGMQLITVLVKTGFQVIRTRDSRYFLRNPDGRTTVVPVHPGETIGPGLLAKILRDSEISREELQSLL